MPTLKSPINLKKNEINHERIPCVFEDRAKKILPRATLGSITISRRDGTRSYEGKVLNASQNGMSIATDLPLNVMSQVEIMVEQSADLPQNKRFLGRVVWGLITQDLDAGKYRYGIKFFGPV